MPPAVSRCLLWIAIIAFCLLFVACKGGDDFQQIRTRIADAATLAEAHDISGLLDLASADVVALPMGLERRGIKAILWRTFNHYGPLTVLYPRPAVEIDDTAYTATARFPFLIVKKKSVLPELEGLRDDPVAWMQAAGDSVDLYRLQLEWIKEGGQWLVRRAELQRFKGVDFN